MKTRLLILPVPTLLLLAACAGLPQRSEAPSFDPDHPRIIDARASVEFTGYREDTSGIPMTRQEYLREAEAAGISETVTSLGPGGEYRTDQLGSNVVFCAEAGAKVDVKRLTQSLQSGKYGCIAIFPGDAHQWATDRNYEPAYHLAEQFRVPVVFQASNTRSMAAELKYLDPLTVDEVAVAHRDVTFVIANCGIPWIRSAAEVARKNPNVYLDGPGLLTGNLGKEPRERVDEYVVKPLAWLFGYLGEPGKLMFGSDWPLNDMKSSVEAFKRAIPKQYWQAVFHDNAALVFGLK